MYKNSFSNTARTDNRGYRGYRGIIHHPRAAHAVPSDKLDDATFVSGDEVNRAEAFELGYGTVASTLARFANLRPGDLLVIDYDAIMFNDKDAAVALALEAVQRGVNVRLNTYHPDDPALESIDRDLRKAA